jgi:hypothetical protein
VRAVDAQQPGDHARGAAAGAGGIRYWSRAKFKGTEDEIVLLDHIVPQRDKEQAGSLVDYLTRTDPNRTPRRILGTNP